MTSPSIDLDRLMKMRLVVARFGEMDVGRWWKRTRWLAERFLEIQTRGGEA